MALGKNDGFGDSNFIVLTPITRNEDKEEIAATFKVSRKNEEGNLEETKETVDNVTGDIFRVETYSIKYNPKTRKLVKEDEDGIVSWGYKILMRDDVAGEVYLIKSMFNLLTRDLANKLLSLDTFTGVTIGVYKNNKTGFNNAYVKTGPAKEDLVRWKYERDEIPKADEITNPRTGEVTQRDYTVVDEFFIEKLNTFAKENKLTKEDRSVAAVKAAVQQEEAVEEDSHQNASSQDDDKLWE
jgi:hypothetical protein